MLLRDGCIVGRPRFPVGTSVATTNVTDRLVNAVSCCFAQIGPAHGMAEGGYQQALGLAVISGQDPRRDGQTYVNQMFIGFGGGPGLPGHDGWVTYGGPVDGSMQILSPTEVDESMFPIHFECRELAIDTLGHGEWDGAPGTLAVYGPVAGEMTAVYCSDGDTYPSKGVRGGSDGAPSVNQKRSADGTLVTLPSFHEERCAPGEMFRFVTTAGGGYGEPTRREPEAVARAVDNGWLSPEKAAEVYAVALRRAEDGIGHEVDADETGRLRQARNGGAEA